jgi:hypothetical protein
VIEQVSGDDQHDSRDQEYKEILMEILLGEQQQDAGDE